MMYPSMPRTPAQGAAPFVWQPPSQQPAAAGTPQQGQKHLRTDEPQCPPKHDAYRGPAVAAIFIAEDGGGQGADDAPVAMPVAMPAVVMKVQTAKTGTQNKRRCCCCKRALLIFCALAAAAASVAALDYLLALGVVENLAGGSDHEHTDDFSAACAQAEVHTMSDYRRWSRCTRLSKIVLEEGHFDVHGNDRRLRTLALATATTLAFDVLEAVEHNIFISGVHGISTLAFPSLENTGSVVIRNMPELEEVDMPTLRVVERSLEIVRNGNLRSVLLPRVQVPHPDAAGASVTGTNTLVIEDNAALETVDVSALNDWEGDLVHRVFIAGNAALQEIRVRGESRLPDADGRPVVVVTDPTDTNNNSWNEHDATTTVHFAALAEHSEVCGKGCDSPGISCNSQQPSSLTECYQMCAASPTCLGFQAPDPDNGFHGWCVTMEYTPTRYSHNAPAHYCHAGQTTFVREQVVAGTAVGSTVGGGNAIVAAAASVRLVSAYSADQAITAHDATSGQTTGLLQMSVDGAWKYVCDDVFDRDMHGATVACGELGFSGGASHGDGTAHVDLFYDDIHCTGTESSLTDCSRTAGDDCATHEAVMLTCVTAPEPASAPAPAPAPPAGTNAWKQIPCGDRCHPIQWPYDMRACYPSAQAHEACAAEAEQHGALAFSLQPCYPEPGTDKQFCFTYRDAPADPAACQTDVFAQETCTYPTTFWPDVDRVGSFFIRSGRAAERFHTPAASSVRLVSADGTPTTGQSAGLLQMSVDGAWKYVCDDVFDLDMHAATVACTELGFSGGASHGDGTAHTDMFYDDIKCTGTESSLADCSRTVGDDCMTHEAVMLTCFAVTTSSVRLVSADGTPTTGQSAGLLQMSVHGAWKYVCDDVFDLGMHAATVACAELGFSGGASHGDGTAHVDLFYDDINCTGAESSLADCPRTVGDDCATHEAVMLTCSAATTSSVRLVSADGTPTTGQSAGLLQMSVDGAWKYVCDDVFDLDMHAATVACGELGFDGGASHGDGTAHVDLFYDDINCTGAESSLADCPRTVGDDCATHEAVMLTCSASAPSAPTNSQYPYVHPGVGVALYDVHIDDQCNFPEELDSTTAHVGHSDQVNFTSRHHQWNVAGIASNVSGLRNHFAAVFTGTIHVTTGGSYTFSLESDDGSWLDVDNQLVVDNGGCKPMQKRTGNAISLAAGPHAFEVRFTEHGGGAGVILRWSGPDSGNREVVVPATAFNPLLPGY